MSNNDGCAVARSAEAKALGIKMGEPWFQLQPLVKRNGLIGLSSNYTLYGDMSTRVMQVLRLQATIKLDKWASKSASLLPALGWHAPPHAGSWEEIIARNHYLAAYVIRPYYVLNFAYEAAKEIEAATARLWRCSTSARALRAWVRRSVGTGRQARLMRRAAAAATQAVFARWRQMRGERSARRCLHARHRACRAWRELHRACRAWRERRAASRKQKDLRRRYALVLALGRWRRFATARPMAVVKSPSLLSFCILLLVIDLVTVCISCLSCLVCRCEVCGCAHTETPTKLYTVTY